MKNLQRGDKVECSDFNFEYPIEGRKEEAIFECYSEDSDSPCIVKSDGELFSVKECRKIEYKELIESSIKTIEEFGEYITLQITKIGSTNDPGRFENLSTTYEILTEYLETLK